MDWLDYHHLLYFWAVARHGIIVRASAELHLSQPTISGQIRRLAKVLGEKLFDRVGRHLVLTEAGRTTYQYADEIFSLGRDLLATLKGRPTGCRASCPATTRRSAASSTRGSTANACARRSRPSSTTAG